MSKEFDFEKALKRIEEINTTLEKGDLQLDKSLEIYEEGISLANKCYKTLGKAKVTVEEIDKTIDLKSLSDEGE